MIKRIISCIPNAITSLNLISGCLAVMAAFNYENTLACGLTGAECACIFMGMAAIFDFCDGAAARLLHAYSDLGKQLDSLADLVSFGVAPAMLMFNLVMTQGTITWPAFLVLMIPVAGALRLARFNIDDSQTTSFVGMPIPGNAIFLIGVYGWVAKYAYPGWPVMILLFALTSWLMVCRLPMFSLKFKNFDLHENFRRYVILLAAVAFVVFYGLSGFAWTIILYVLLSAMSRKRA